MEFDKDFQVIKLQNDDEITELKTNANKVCVFEVTVATSFPVYFVGYRFLYELINETVHTNPAVFQSDDSFKVYCAREGLVLFPGQPAMIFECPLKMLDVVMTMVSVINTATHAGTIVFHTLQTVGEHPEDAEAKALLEEFRTTNFLDYKEKELICMAGLWRSIYTRPTEQKEDEVKTIDEILARNPDKSPYFEIHLVYNPRTLTREFDATTGQSIRDKLLFTFPDDVTVLQIEENTEAIACLVLVFDSHKKKTPMKPNGLRDVNRIALFSLEQDKSLFRPEYDTNVKEMPCESVGLINYEAVDNYPAEAGEIEQQQQPVSSETEAEIKEETVL